MLCFFSNILRLDGWLDWLTVTGRCVHLRLGGTFAYAGTSYILGPCIEDLGLNCLNDVEQFIARLYPGLVKRDSEWRSWDSVLRESDMVHATHMAYAIWRRIQGGVRLSAQLTRYLQSYPEASGNTSVRLCFVYS